jgi:hypothetical protein
MANEPASKGIQKVLVSLEQHKRKSVFSKEKTVCGKLLLTHYYSSYTYLWSWYELNVNTPRSVCASKTELNATTCHRIQKLMLSTQHHVTLQKHTETSSLLPLQATYCHQQVHVTLTIWTPDLFLSERKASNETHQSLILT